VAWARGDAGFFYTRYPRAGERPAADESFYQQVYFHPLGTDSGADKYELGKDLPRISEIQLDVDARSGRVLASVQRGDGGETSHYLRDPRGKWRRFTDFGDGIVQVAFGPKDELYLLSRKGSSRGKILRIDATTLDVGKAVTVIPEMPQALVSEFWDPDTLVPTTSRLYVTYQMGGPSVVRAFDHLGASATWASPLDVSATSGLIRDGESGVLFQTESFLVPGAWYRFDETARTATKTALIDEAPVSLSSYSVVREIAKSKDGTEVPLSILLPPGAKRDGGNACVVTGYGGYGKSLEPRFRPDNTIWLEQGVIVVVANLRGGGEFGEEWHRNGMLEKKQNVFDDFAAVLNHLVDRRYTNPSRLGIIGGSNGGLLMGATLVQHPDLVKAVVSSVGIYDCLREELLPNGAFNVTEFGTVKDPKEFAALYAYSPYHHVADGVRYPATLLVTGENDPRVGPMQSRKMAARLQAATAGQTPVLLRTSAGTGHGLDTALDERILEKADATAFLMKELGVEFQVSRP
jgi:prolyl oligopeptidase